MPFNKDPNFWLSVGSGLLSGGTSQQQMANMGQNLAQYNMTAEQKALAAAEKAKADATQNRTLQYLMQNDPEIGAAMQAGLPANEALKMYMTKRTEAAKPATMPSSVQEYQFAKNNGFQGSFMDFKNGVGAANGPEYGLQPVYGTDANGKTIILQLGKNGQPIQPKLPDGFNPTPGLVQVDQGTSTRLINNKTGATVETVSKNIADTETQKIQGKLTGEAVQALPATIAKADMAIATIDKALEHKGRETGTGFSSILDPRNYIPGTNAADFQVVNQQLQGQAFLEAFQNLKGAGQITEVEGAKATAAMARLSTAQSDEEYKKGLMELREIIVNGKERARAIAGNPQALPTDGTSTTRNGVKFKVLP